MTARDDFMDDRVLVPYLAGQLVKGRLVLILGSGISKPFGLPTWETLIKKLYKSQKTALPKGHTSEVLAEQFSNTFFKNNYPGYIESIHKALYENVDASFLKLRSNLTLASIGSLVMASRRGSVSNVITLNFDDLLELYLNYHGFVTRSLSYNAGHLDWAAYADVTVYHLHGMIPFNFTSGYNKKIIFDQKSFNDITGQEQNPWRQLVLTIMRRHTCLFIGLSGEDRNLDSILSSVFSTHAICEENKALYWGITFSTNEAASNQWAERGIFCKNIANYKHELPRFLFSICQEATKM